MKRCPSTMVSNILSVCMDTVLTLICESFVIHRSNSQILCFSSRILLCSWQILYRFKVQDHI